MEEFTWFKFLTSAGVVSALIATGAFVQKCRDNTVEILALKDRVKQLENERVEIAALVEKVNNLGLKITENKVEMKENFTEIKDLIRGVAFKTHKSGL